ncbi:sensor histidine kinase [Reichenbachiella ulvae]|uniref:histidine kinase n=1 Tax=Reichenbachiella ulvae TaxID=2980104 RepID=A0ABT3CQ75_9BACT|nr:sensor histidine kinase [Reichenbachiella ulvae]MCV9385870.1 ATP-binding protein [Reichenbachiella ulvae]
MERLVLKGVCCLNSFIRKGLLGLIAMLGCFTMAYSDDVQAIGDLTDYSIYQWTAKDGLTSNNITSVYQDSRGLIWLTSFNGVMIYDTERIEVYDKNHFPFLDNDGFHSVSELSDSTVLLGSQGNGIIKFKNGQFDKLNISQGPEPKSIRCILVDENDNIYTGTDNLGLIKISGNNSQSILEEELGKLTIKSICKGKNGAIWIGTEGQGVYSISATDTLHFGVKDGLHSNTINALGVDAYGRIHVGNNGGYQVIDAANNVLSYPELKDIYVNTLFLDNEGAVWLGSELGVFKFHEDSRKLSKLASKRGVDLVRISKITSDNEGNIWVSSNRSGLMRFKESLVSTILKPTISGDRIFVVYESQDGRRFVTTDQPYIDICDSVCQRLELKSNLYDNGVRDILFDSDSSLWFATYGGMIHYQDGEESVYDINEGMPANNFRVVHKDQFGNYWFGSRSGGLVKFRDGEIKQIYNRDNGLESNFILSIEESAAGNLYLGTHSGGLTVLSPDGDMKIYHLKEDDSGVLFFNIDLNEDGTALLASTIGIVYFDGKNLDLVQLKYDPISRTFFDIIKDDFGSIWVTSNKGVLRISTKEFEAYKRGEISELGYQVLDENDGMYNEECTGATRATKMKDGRIMIPTLAGVCVLDPRKMSDEVYVPNVIIRHMIADQETELAIITQEELEVNPEVKRLAFQFAALSFLSPERNVYKYMLKGFDSQWSEPTTLGEIEYTNLRPGEYTFQVMASHDGEHWSSEPASLQFIVKPYFYETIWFLLLVAIFVFLLIWAIYEWRLSFINRQNKELKKVNEELDRFVYSASHEMRSPLSSILGLVHIARSDKSGDLNMYFNHIESSVMRLDDFIKDIIDYSRNARLGVISQEIDLRELIDSILHGISFTENYKIISHNIDIPEGLIFNSDRGRLKIVLSNLITNAFKHHAPDKVKNPWVSIKVEKLLEGIRIEIQDNGLGIDPKHISDIFKMFYRATTLNDGSGLGLYMVKEIIAKLNGTVDVHSELQKGTTFEVYIPELPAKD